MNLASNTLGGYHDNGKLVNAMSGIKAIADALSVNTSLNSQK